MTQAAMMRRGEQGVAFWFLPDWQDHHKFLTKEFDCHIPVGDALLRFFLRPFEKTVPGGKAGQVVTLKFYSLWVEVMSSQTKLFIQVDIKRFFPEWSANRRCNKSGVCQVTLDRLSPKCDGKLLVEEMFIFMGSSRIDLAPRHPTFSEHTFKSDRGDVTIQFEVTLYHPNRDESSGPPPENGKEICAAPTHHFASLLDDNGNPIFPDVELEMEDGVLLPAHRAVLAAHSSSLRNKFAVELELSKSTVFDMTSVNSAAMKIVLKYLYTEKMEENWEEHYDEILFATNVYNFPKLMEFLEQKAGQTCVDFFTY